MSNIQQARDVLAKWRRSATKLPWERTYDDEGTVRQELTGYSVGDNVDDDDARLIVGTAGNPDLLDAIDFMLANARLHASTFNAWVKPIAAAIIAADERMNA